MSAKPMICESALALRFLLSLTRDRSVVATWLVI